MIAPHKVGWFRSVLACFAVASLPALAGACAMETGPGDSYGERGPGNAKYELLGGEGAGGGGGSLPGNAPVTLPNKASTLVEPLPQPWTGPQDGTDNSGDGVEPQPNPWMNGTGEIVNATAPSDPDHHPHYPGKL